MEQIIKILAYMLQSFIHIWPYLLVTIPLAVAVQLSGVSKYINKALSKNPYISIILATAIGAISPFCSCGVIPVITSLLIGGVPLAPVMSFWIASPSMDPEIFMLSVATIGWKLSVWRLGATFVISLSSGLITHFAQRKGFFGARIMRSGPEVTDTPRKRNSTVLFDYSNRLFAFLIRQKNATIQLHGVNRSLNTCTTVNCCVPTEDPVLNKVWTPLISKNSSSCEVCKNPEIISPGRSVMVETWKAFSMVAKFMSIAFFINALINFYLPQDFLTGYLGVNGQLSVLIAALIGIPFYTSNLTALPVISGLLSLGMNQGAALAFLIAGPVTTLPAMMAVWGIVRPKVFYMYLFFSFTGALLSGYLFNILN